MIKSQVNGFAKGKISPDLLISDSFDLICNGEEILSGGMRINNRFIQERVFELLGYNEESRDENFGYFLKALGFAAPPHGGFGLGIDRLLSVLLGSSNLKELIAFPKNIDGTCSLTDAPNLM
jgi:aspartyl-tRNA synthetase